MNVSRPHFKSPLIQIIGMLLVSMQLSNASDDMSLESLLKTRATHGALAQYHRWFQVYERPLTEESLTHQIEVLTNNVEINSVSGAAKGHAGYKAAVMQLPSENKNSHRVQSVTVSEKASGELKLDAKVLYQGLLPDGTINTYNLSYDTALEQRSEGLPQFNQISISVESSGESSAFVDTYVENRVKSFIHYWLFLVEAVDGNSEPFRELLMREGLSLAFSAETPPITSFSEFQTWNSGAPKFLKASSHQVENLSISGTENINVILEFRWKALSQDDKKITGRTQHTWALLDTGEKFLRLKEATVVWLEPMSVTE